MEEFSLDLACVTVVIPAYNEAATIAAVIRAVLAQPLVRELVVVDDCSRDGTWEAIGALAATDVRIRALRHEVNRGKGAALRTAFRHASSPVVLVQDADLEYDPTEYAALVGPITDGLADAVYGVRFHGASGAGGRWHAAGNRLVTEFSNLCTSQRLTDMATGFKVFRRELIERIDFEEDRFGFDAEVTVKLARLGGVRLCEVPITYRARNRAQGKKIGWRDGFSFLRCIVKYSFARA